MLNGTIGLCIAATIIKTLPAVLFVGGQPLPAGLLIGDLSDVWILEPSAQPAKNPGCPRSQGTCGDVTVGDEVGSRFDGGLLPARALT